MAVEQWENADQFNVLRDKYNNSVDEIGKIKRDSAEPLEYISDVLSSGIGIEVDHTQGDGKTYVSLKDAAANPKGFMRVNTAGTEIVYQTFDTQHTSVDFGDTLKPASSAGEVFLGPLIATPGNFRTYVINASIVVEKSSTSPHHVFQLRRNGVVINQQVIYIVAEGRHTYTINFADSTQAPGTAYDVYISISGSSNQYKYHNAYLTIQGVPA